MSVWGFAGFVAAICLLIMVLDKFLYLAAVALAFLLLGGAVAAGLWLLLRPRNP